MGRPKKVDLAQACVQEPIMIRPQKWANAIVPIRGISPLIVQAPSEAVVSKIVDKQTGNAQPKGLRDLDKEYESCFHRIDKNTTGFPASGFYGGILSVAPDLGLEKTKIKRSLRIIENTPSGLVPIECDHIEKVRDITRNQGMSHAPDYRMRPYYHGWKAKLHVMYDTEVFSLSDVINLIARAGTGAGIGAWRPSSPHGGNNGLYEPEPSGGGK